MLLARPGAYRATVWTADGAFEATVAEALFEEPEEEVELRLPEGTLSGVVVDRVGRPAADAAIFAQSAASAHDREEEGASRLPLRGFARADAAGRFEISGLAPAHWELRASLGRNRARSREVTVELGADEVVPGLRLVLEEGRPLTVEVRMGGRPMAGVPGSAWFLAADGELLGQLAGFATDLEGRYRFAAPPGEVAFVQLVLQPAAAPVASFRLAFAEELAVELPALGGRVELVVPAERLPGLDPSHLVLVHEGGASIPLGYLRAAGESRSADGSSVVALPLLTSGRWRLLALDSAADWRLLVVGQEIGRDLGSFDLAPGGAARVALPAPAALAGARQ